MQDLRKSWIKEELNVIAQKCPASSLSNHQEADAAFDVVTTPTWWSPLWFWKAMAFNVSFDLQNQIHD